MLDRSLMNPSSFHSHLILWVELFYSLLEIVLQAWQEISVLGSAGLQIIRVQVPESSQARVTKIHFILRYLLLDLAQQHFTINSFTTSFTHHISQLPLLPSVTPPLSNGPFLCHILL